MTTTFSYSGRFSKDSVETAVGHPTHAKYDFGTAYPPPETAPSNELVEGLIKGLKREGQDLVYYPDSNGNLALREFTAKKTSLQWKAACIHRVFNRIYVPTNSVSNTEIRRHHRIDLTLSPVCNYS